MKKKLLKSMKTPEVLLGCSETNASFMILFVSTNKESCKG